MNKKKALFCAGSFWDSQIKFSKIKGVIATNVGYEGGNLPYPTYDEVSNGNTGHVETVEVIYNAEVISYEDLLKEFWKIHDPTSLEQNGFSGTQHKSTIFYFDEEEKKIAENSKLEIQKHYNTNVITEIKKGQKFYLAEGKHQYYLLKQGKEI